jgi:hypothetical protein
MANLKICDLHTTDSEIHELSNMNSFKIRNLSINTSEMRLLNNDELQNIAGGSRVYTFSAYDSWRYSNLK